MRKILAVIAVAGLAVAALQQAAVADAGGRAGVDAASRQLAQVTVPEPARVLDQAGARAFPDDRILGEKDAPVTIIEYASLTCPHCAHFHNEVLPKLKKEFVEPGKVRLIYRDYPLDRYALLASMLARCAPPDRYFPFLEVLFRSQHNWARAKDPAAALAQIARLAGLQQDKIDACVTDEAVQKDILNQRLDATKRLGINSTPTLIVNGRMYVGGLPFDELKAVIDSILPKT